MNYALILGHIVFQRTGIWPDMTIGGPFDLSKNESVMVLSRWTVDANPPDISAFTLEDDAAAALAYDAYRQASKSAELKAAENKFIAFCDQFTMGAHTKLSIGQLEAIGETLPEQTRKDAMLELVAIDSKLKTLTGSNDWWFDCAYHP